MACPCDLTTTLKCNRGKCNCDKWEKKAVVSWYALFMAKDIEKIVSKVIIIACGHLATCLQKA